MWKIFYQLVVKSLFNRTKTNFNFYKKMIKKANIFQFNWKSKIPFLTEINRINDMLAKTSKENAEDYLKRKSRVYRQFTQSKEKFEKQQKKEMEKKQRDLEKEIKKEFEKATRETKKQYDKNDKDFKSFAQFFSSLSDEEKKRYQEIMENELPMEIVFYSSWIYFGAFTPYYDIREDVFISDKKVNFKNTSSTRGIMQLIFKEGSDNNPSGVYSWVNVSYYQWKRIIQDPTGKNFWEKFYRVNRKKMKYLTPDSIYYKTYKPRKKRKNKRI